ncbi:MiaB/RimO family radical SAM methylthiotransferase [Candidatus Margulisiibacteriota bacterium]
MKKDKPHLKIGVCGCLVSEPDRDVKQIFPHVDIFIAPNQPERLVEFLSLNDAALSTKWRGGTARRAVGEGTTAWVTIMHGCDNFCSYCVVPHVRGRETSRPMEEILAEIKQIDTEQHKEVFLLGQNVNSYKYGLADLLRKIEERMRARTRTRIRFMTSHPRDMSDDIIDAVRDLPHVCEFFHLPLQHGDDAILKSMNRGYNTDYYLKLVDRIRAKIPGAAITSDVIVGYPGETDQQFQNTLKMIEKVGFDTSNTLAYSTRPGTAASKLADDVPDKVKQERLQQAMAVVAEVSARKNQALVGSSQEILVDFTGKKSCSGRTRTNKIVKFTSQKKNLLGRLVNAKITSAKSWVLEGEEINGKF